MLSVLTMVCQHSLLTIGQWSAWHLTIKSQDLSTGAWTQIKWSSVQLLWGSCQGDLEWTVSSVQTVRHSIKYQAVVIFPVVVLMTLETLDLTFWNACLCNYPSL